ncbi:hypothetical protein SOVF_170230 [Spinacia oleracea]|nr:hypothetical protein SOVF_170230 [Spinacia oleracea]
MSGKFKGVNVDEINEEDDNGVESRREKESKKKGRLALFGGCSGKKKVVFSPLNKFQRFYKRYKRCSPSSFSSHQISNLSSSNYSCCLCLMSNPQTLESDYDGIDPNDPNVPCDFIKSLIQDNDFYSKECNTHF